MPDHIYWCLRAGATALLTAALLSTSCRSTPPHQEMPRARAIEIAQREINFEPATTDVRRTSSGGCPVWRIEFRGRLPGQPPMLFESRIVEIDRITGEIVSVTRP